MDDDGTDERAEFDPWTAEIERAVLSETEEGRTISAGFISAFGEFVSGTVRPILRDVAEEGGEPQLLVNGLAQLLREVADSMELPLGVESSALRRAAAATDDPSTDDVSAAGTDPA
jgi:hypothetical protein